MIDLEKVSGLPISIDKNYQLIFREPLREIIPNIRTLDQMKPVLLDPDAKPKPDTKEMYYMYRGIHNPEDEKILKDNNIRYDFTVTPPVMIGQEFNKMLGHYHAENSSGLMYPEVYEVIHGHALFLFQKMTNKFKELVDVIYIEVSTGEKVVIPPNHGHIMVNLGADVLVTANWSADNFESNYEPIKEKHGMAYYVVAYPDKRFAFVQNPNYASVPPVRELIQSQFAEQFPIAKNEPMYKTAIKNPQTVEFLNIPEKYTLEFSKLVS
jgi:glucose-6-phosphate isomerase